MVVMVKSLATDGSGTLSFVTASANTPSQVQMDRH